MNHYPHHIDDFAGVNHKKTHKLPMVYVLASHDLSIIKIGMTTSAKQRFINIQSACPFHVSLWAAIRTPIPLKVERWLHSEFAEFRTKGEWFALPEPELSRLHRIFAETNKHVAEVLNGPRP